MGNGKWEMGNKKWKNGKKGTFLFDHCDMVSHHHRFPRSFFFPFPSHLSPLLSIPSFSDIILPVSYYHS